MAEARNARVLVDEIRTLRELLEAPAPLEVVADTFDEGTVCLLAGYWGTAKSFVGVSLGASLATGAPWFTRQVQQRRVLYIAAEGTYGIAARFDAWQKHHQITIPERELEVLTIPVQLNDAEKVEELCAAIRAHGYRFIVIDTLSKSIVGMDENSAKDMSGAVSALYDILDATNGGNVLVIHHTGKDKTTVRGSSALEAGVDIAYQIDRDGDLFRLHRTKRKDGPMEDERSFELIPVENTNSVVLSVRWSPDMTGNAKTVLSALVQNFGANGATKAELRSVVELASSSFFRAVKSLLDQGHIRNTGTDARPFYKPTSLDMENI
ncbi:AAA family ATPase [Leifsonia naganoensis]|uniref:RecA-family ATPase n=1 Tax=Leifsonia naganoensis TaxID=150025 RepID=A0A853DM48_9MICO|nr:AAA family ATPase [Leifsonia naganoensis]NYK08579.1 RecA-family ATPase [Leifsonia naganoensis]